MTEQLLEDQQLGAAYLRSAVWLRSRQEAAVLSGNTDQSGGIGARRVEVWTYPEVDKSVQSQW